MLAAIIQARLGSTRLPGKTLADLQGKPMLARLVERVRAVRGIDAIVVATTTAPSDEPIVEFAASEGLPCFRGSEEDVLDRFYQTARHFEVRDIIRVTPDCPLIDPRVIEEVVAAYRKGGYDYVSNIIRRTFPDGLDVEVFSIGTLERTWRETTRTSDREHVTPYMRTAGFRVFNVEHPVNLSHFRWAVDRADDLAFVRAVYARLGQNGRLFHLEDVLDLLSREPQLTQISTQGTVNEGFYRSLLKDPVVPVRPRSLQRSAEWRGRAERVIPGASQTFSKGPTQFVQGVAPTFLTRGDGCRVWDVDGNDYIDYSLALGPIILGYGYPSVIEAVTRQLASGTTFSLPHPLEVELSEQLVEAIPCAEMVRFGKNGSDVTAGAVRLARACTGREHIAFCGYHGWQDWYIGSTTRNAGVPEAVRRLTHGFAYNDLPSLERIFDAHPGEVAAVIMEPVGVVEPAAGFLQEVRALTRARGALLIFDEVLTGYRLAIGGAQEYFGVTPDLACLGKAIANGFPLAALVGRRVFMRRFEDVFFSFTFGGETLSLAAALATLEVLRTKPVIRHIWTQGERLWSGYNVLARELGVDQYTSCAGLAPRTVVRFADASGAESLVLKSLFQQECAKRGVLFGGGHNLSYSHTEGDVDSTLRVYRDALATLAEAIRHDDAERRLEGPVLQPIFRRP